MAALPTDVLQVTRRAKYYPLTSRGERQLANELESRERFTGAVRLVLEPGHRPP